MTNPRAQALYSVTVELPPSWEVVAEGVDEDEAAEDADPPLPPFELK